MTSTNKYGLFTCISMITGVVIGSGIFFKSDDILIATGGSIFLGGLAFCIAAIRIIFGCLTIAQLAAHNDKAGGVISYAEESYSGGVACAFGWFQTFLYYPVLTVVLSFVVGIYVCLLLGITPVLEWQLLIGLLTVFMFFIINTFSTKLAGYFQNTSAVVKMVPLFLIGIAGFIFAKPDVTVMVSPAQLKSATWLSALTPIIFAFDGWIVATSISHEVKNAKKNIPLALILSPLIILAIYLLYFVGISMYLGPEVIMETQDAHVQLAAIQLLGPWAGKALFVFVTISVLGTTNGLIMGLSNMPYSLALRNMFPYSKTVALYNKKLKVPLYSYWVSLGIVLFWTVIHYVTQKFKLLPGNSDISEIPLTLNYVLFIFLYVEVFKRGLRGEIKGFWKGKFYPIMATIGSLILLYVGLQNTIYYLYMGVCIIFLFGAYVFWKKHTVKK